MAAAHGAGGGEPLFPESGFRASLRGASLPDLVQMECLSRGEGVFRVSSGSRIGYLMFRRGQLVHAVTGALSGDSAALEILKWRQGTFDPCNVTFPEQTSIRSGWQDL